MAANKGDLVLWVRQAVQDFGGKASIIEVAEHIWKNHEPDLKGSNIFYTWQYDMRWAAQKLRDDKIFASAVSSPRGLWQLANN